MGGVGRITWPLVDRWAQRYGIEGEEFDALWHLIREMDAVFLEHHAPPSDKGPRAWGSGTGENRKGSP
jgi:hypothetical protein